MKPSRASPWRRVAGHVLLAACSALAAIGTAVAVGGCASSTCAETETCPDLDAGAMSDHSTGTKDAGPTDSTTAGEEHALEAEADDAEADSQPPPDASDGCVDTGPEDCTDGIDNDCNGLVDCADPACQELGFACTPAAPLGWFGPGALFDGEAGAAPACAAPYASNSFTLNSGTLSAAPADCACSCGSMSNECTNPTITVYTDNVCGAANSCGAGGPTTCTVADGSRCTSGGTSAQVTTMPGPSGTGSCAPSANPTALPPPTWTREGEACTAAVKLESGGCDAGYVCAGSPPPSFVPQLCVWKPGDLDCMDAGAGPNYPLAYRYYPSNGFMEGRGCNSAGCSCTPNASTVMCSLTSARAFTTSNCEGGIANNFTSLMTGMCNNIGSNAIVSIITTVGSSGSCSSGGTASPTGSVSPDPSTITTVCCAQ